MVLEDTGCPDGDEPASLGWTLYARETYFSVVITFSVWGPVSLGSISLYAGDPSSAIAGLSVAA